MKYRKQILTLHKILGLVTGVIVFVVSITGCCWAFKEEIESLYGDYKKVTPQDQAILTPTAAKTLAKEVIPNHAVHGTLFQKSDDAIEVIFYEEDPEFYQSVFLNPYSGEIIQVNDNLSGFFPFILDGHMRLWLPKDIGEEVVSAAVLIFIIIVISGFLLWMPKQRKHIKDRLKFDWNKKTRWKRKNYDIHSILGFYISGLALVLAITGSVLSYEFLQYALYKSTGGEKVAEFIIPDNTSGKFVKNNSIQPLDQLIIKLQKESPNAESIELHYPHSENASVFIEVSHSKGLFYDADYRFFDQNTLEEIETPSIYGKYEDAKFADKLLRMNYDIHIGAIGGLTGKIIAFLISLLTASLPITGALLWYGRTYKEKRRKKKLLAKA